jgi:hypothetical protein
MAIVLTAPPESPSRCPSLSLRAGASGSLRGNTYKDVEHVVDVIARAGIARKVARMVPLGVLKG